MRGLGVDVGVAPDAGHNLPRGQAGVVRVTAFEHTADNAFLAPHGARRQVAVGGQAGDFCTGARSEEHTSELQSLMRISYAVFCLKKKTKQNIIYMKNKK